MPETGFLIISHVKIAPGKSGAFVKGAQELAGEVEAIADGPHRWEIFVSEDREHAYLAGHYRTSDEWLRVASTTVPIMQRMLDVASFADMVVLGAPSGKARQLLSRFAPRFCAPVAGYRHEAPPGLA